MTYQEKVEWLRGYARQLQYVEELNRETEELQKFMEEQRSQVSGGKGDWLRSRQSKEAETLHERQLVLAREQRRLAALGDMINAAIERLQEPRQRRVLRQIYLMGMSQNQVCEQLHYCKRQVSRSHLMGVTALEPRAEELAGGSAPRGV